MPIYKTYCCINCNLEVTKANSKEKFCSIKCQADYGMEEKVRNGQASAKTISYFGKLLTKCRQSQVG